MLELDIMRRHASVSPRPSMRLYACGSNGSLRLLPSNGIVLCRASQRTNVETIRHMRGSKFCSSEVSLKKGRRKVTHREGFMLSSCSILVKGKCCMTHGSLLPLSACQPPPRLPIGVWDSDSLVLSRALPIRLHLVST